VRVRWLLRARSAAGVLLGVLAVVMWAGAAASAAPDGRGWELASAPDKNGGDVIPMSVRTRAAAGGGAVGFSSLVGFGDVRGATIGTEYIAQRTAVPGTSGWATHAITPTQAPLPQIGAAFGLDPAYDGEMSADLSAGVFRAYRPITDAPNVAGLLNLYVRRDLRTPGAGFYELITDPGFAMAPGPSPDAPVVAGASRDFSHVIFESHLNLDPDTSGSDPKLYEWANGTLRLAGILPDGTAAPSSQAGQGSLNFKPTVHMISSDGSRIFFQVPGTGNIYMRVNGTTTVQLNASEKTVPESPQGATLWDASADGTRIFFSTSEGLVDGDDDSSEDYYMYDVTGAPGHRLTLISRDGEPGDVDSGLGVIGTSDDGRYLYFMMFGQLVAGEDELVPGLFVWHDGAVRYIGAFALGSADTTVNSLDAPWFLVSLAQAARVSADGSHLMFAATSDDGFRGRDGFAGFDHGGAQEFYVYDATDGQLRCASCDPSGALPTGSAQVNTKVDSYASDVATTSHRGHFLSNDGRWAFFNSPDALVPQDVNGRIDAYAYDSATQRVSLLSSGRSSSDSYFLDASESGADAFFVTRERLVGWDTDDNYDLYDARVGGGLPEPVALPPACAGESCQGSGPASVSPVSSASSGFSGKGDAAGKLKHRAKRKRCKQGARRVVRRGKVRCVRKKAHRRHHAKSVRTAGGVAR